MSIPLVCGLAALTIIGIVLFGRRNDPHRPRCCRCCNCRHGLPEDNPDYPLQDREWQQVRQIEAFYRKTAHDPMTARRRRWPSRSR